MHANCIFVNIGLLDTKSAIIHLFENNVVIPISQDTNVKVEQILQTNKSNNYFIALLYTPGCQWLLDSSERHSKTFNLITVVIHSFLYVKLMTSVLHQM